MYVSLEISHGEKENVRGLFERMVRGCAKKRRAEVVFRRWREWEVGTGGEVKRVEGEERKWDERNAGEKEE